MSLTGSLADIDGSPVQLPDALSVKAVAGPSVVRFRPRNGWTDVARDARLSVRFTQPMERKSTIAAWSATANGTKLTGTFLWGENDTVLAFLPSKAFPAGAKIVMTVGVGATSKAGVPLDKLTSAHATVLKAVKKSRRAAARRRRSPSRTVRAARSGPVRGTRSRPTTSSS